MSSVAMSYDKKYDILYARYPNAGDSYGEEDDNGIVIFHNIQDDSVTGVAVYSISEKLKNGEIDLNELPVSLNRNRIAELGIA